MSAALAHFGVPRVRVFSRDVPSKILAPSWAVMLVRDWPRDDYDHWTTIQRVAIAAGTLRAHERGGFIQAVCAVAKLGSLHDVETLLHAVEVPQCSTM